MSWTTLLPRSTAVSNGRLVTVETQMRTLYRYYIHATEQCNYQHRELITSRFDYNTARAALFAGIRAAKNLPSK